MCFHQIVHGFPTWGHSERMPNSDGEYIRSRENTDSLFNNIESDPDINLLLKSLGESGRTEYCLRRVFR